MSDLQVRGPLWGSSGAPAPFTAAKSGAQRIVDAHGRYFDAADTKRLYFAATQAGQTTSAGLATTYVGLVVSNPVGSGFNLAINKVGWAWTVIATVVDAIALGVGFSANTNVTHTTPLSVFGNIFNGNSNAAAKADSSATLPTAPVYYMFLDNTPTATTNPKGGVIDLEGGLIIPPGAYVMTLASAASSAAAFWASIQWEEVPILT